MSRYLAIGLAMLLASCGTPSAESLTLYSGRSKALIEPLVAQFTEKTGIAVDARYGDTAQLAIALVEEGEQTPADLFWAQDAGALGAVGAAGMLARLPDSLLQAVQPGFRGRGGSWVATSGRARTLAFSTIRIDTTNLPRSVFDLTDPRFNDRVGWAPSNGSFQAFVTYLRAAAGEDVAASWLAAMKANGAKSYPKNTAILQGIANGEVDYGLPNHYYLFRFKSEDPGFPVGQTTFADGDPGNLVNVAGIGVLEASSKKDAAALFVSFLLGEDSQEYFRTSTHEYPVSGSSTTAATSAASDVDLDDLTDLDGTLAMLRDAGLI